MSPITTSAPSAASRRGDRRADPAGAAGDQRLASLEPHRRRSICERLRLPRLMAPSRAIPIIGGTGALGYGLALRWARAGPRGRDRLARARSAPRRPRRSSREAAARRRGRGPRRTRRPRSRARSSSSPSPSAPSRRPSTTCARRSSRASSWSTARCRWPPPSAARRPARSASGRARPPSRRRRWSPRASTVVAALHTVERADARRPGDAELDEDVLVCGDRKADKARVAELIEAIDGPARRQRRAAGDGADRRAADAAPDLDQRPLQDPRRASGSPACPTATTGRDASSVVCSPAAPAAAKLAAGLQELLGDELTVIANTGDDVEIHGVHVSPDPTSSPTGSPGEIDEERGWGIRGRHVHRLRAPAAARRAGLVRPLGPRPRHLPLPHRTSSPRAAALTAAQAQIARGARGDARGSCRCARSRCAPGSAPPAGWRGAAGVPDPRPGEGDDRRGRARRDRVARGPPRRCSRRSRRPRRS